MSDPGGQRGNRRVVPPVEATFPEAPPSPDPAMPAAPRRRPRWPWLLGGVAAAGLLAASWFALPIRSVEVSGQRHLNAGEVRALAGLTPDFGWLYYGAWRARGLLESPWIASARVTRRFPDHVSVQITERRPVARWQPPGGKMVAVSADGVTLPGAADTSGLPLVTGWGPARLTEALRLVSALGRYNVQSVAYTPSGIRATLPSASVWTGDPEFLLKYAGSISMYPNKTIHIYPWGVSVQE